MIKITLEGSTMAELIRQTIEFVSDASGREVGFVDGAPAEAELPKQEALKQEAPKQEAPKIDLIEVRAACLAYRDKHGQAALAEVFGKFGAKKLTDIPADKYAELLGAVQ